MKDKKQKKEKAKEGGNKSNKVLKKN